MAKKANPIPKEPVPTSYFRAWRKFRGLTQEQLAERVEMSVSSISQVETGNQGWTDRTLMAFAYALGCEPGDLLRPPPTDNEESEFETYVKRLDADRRKRALAILRAALGDDEKSA
ncbi:MAG: helix-turn-helix transcriptional regulator [Parvibaculum sp.]|nr:helix-turn-helix transcriptional regulator [Parvibaculum sp.]